MVDFSSPLTPGGYKKFHEVELITAKMIQSCYELLLLLRLLQILLQSSTKDNGDDHDDDDVSKDVGFLIVELLLLQAGSLQQCWKKTTNRTHVFDNKGESRVG